MLQLRLYRNILQSGDVNFLLSTQYFFQYAVLLDHNFSKIFVNTHSQTS